MIVNKLFNVYVDVLGQLWQYLDFRR